MTADDHTPWTPGGAEDLRNAGERLATAIKAHAAAVAGATGQRDIRGIFAAGDSLVREVLAYVDAQFDYTGTGFPLGIVHRMVDDDDGDGDEIDEGGSERRPTEGLSVLRRHDFGVTDAESVLTAGRAAYLQVWPDDSEADAAADVTHLGRALYQLAHAGGWDSLDRVAGLRPLGGLTRVVDQPDTLDADPDTWPENPFDTDGAIVFEQSDVWE